VLLVELKNIYRSYYSGAETVHALSGVDTAIQEGEFVSIMGRSGSGKSTLLNILGCMDQPTSGEYLLDGQNVASLDDDSLSKFRGERIGFVFQSFHLLSGLSALENVLLPTRYLSQSFLQKNPQDPHQHALNILDRLGLSDRLSHHPNQLSGGQRQRVAIARALINRPRILLADEPTGNLDSNTSREIMQLFHELHAQGQTIILVTHEDDVAEVADRTITMLDGKVLKQ